MLIFVIIKFKRHSIKNETNKTQTKMKKLNFKNIKAINKNLKEFAVTTTVNHKVEFKKNSGEKDYSKGFLEIIIRTPKINEDCRVTNNVTVLISDHINPNKKYRLGMDGGVEYRFV